MVSLTGSKVVAPEPFAVVVAAKWSMLYFGCQNMENNQMITKHAYTPIAALYELNY